MIKAQYAWIGSRGNDMLIREIINGKHVTRVDDSFTPSLFIENKNAKGSYRNIYGKPLERQFFDSIKDFRSYIWNHKDNTQHICGNKSVEYQFIYDLYNKRDDYDPSLLHVCYFDIEVLRDPVRGYAPPDNPFNSVCLITSYLPYKEKGNQIHVFALKDKKYNDNNEAINYRMYNTDKEMIHEFFRFLTENDVDILTGWNVENYDIPYLCGRLLGLWDENKETKARNSYNVDEDITPFGIITRKEVPGAYEKMNAVFEIVGMSTLDYMGLYKKYTYVTQESYSLNNISSVELGEKKVDYSEMQHLQELYEKNYQKFVEYGVKDTILVYKLDEKLQFINLTITLAYIIGCNLTDTASPVRSWEIYLYHEMMNEYIVPPIEKLQSSNNKDGFIGAFVKDPVRGKHDWCISLDLASLYPHIMMFANMSPETYVRRGDMNKDQKLLYQNLQANVEDSIEQLLNHAVDTSVLKERNVAMAPNGAMFSREVMGIIPRIVKGLYSGRKDTKKTMLNKQQEYEDTKVQVLLKLIAALNGKQMAFKILMNALFGACGNEHFIFYNTDIAEGITSMGQVAIRYMGQELEKYLNDMLKTPDKPRVLYTDTDSCDGSSIIFVDGKETTIEDFYNSLDSAENTTESGGKIKKVNTGSTLSVSANGELQEKSIVYAYKHKVKKEMFEITIDGRSVKVTEDHSIIVERDGKIVSVKPKNLQPTDLLLFL